MFLIPGTVLELIKTIKITNLETMKKILFAGALSFTGIVSAQNLQEAILKTYNERYEAAASDFRALIAKESTKGDNYFYYGENFFKSGEVDSADMFYKKGAELSPTYALNFVGIGKVLLSKNDVNGAKTNFFKATSLSQSKSAEVYRKIAEAYLETEYKNPDEAIAAANMAIKLDTKNPDGYIVLGDALLEKNPSEGSGPIKNYKMATTLDPKSAKGIIREGKLYQRGRNYQLALDMYKQAEAIDQNYAPAYREKAELFFLSGQASKSIENWKKYLELNNSDYARYRFMSALFTNKQYADAVTEYEGLKTKGFNNLYLERLAGYSYAEMGDKTDKEAYNKGLVAINKFFEMAGSNFKYLANDYKYKGILLSRTGKDSIAMMELEKAIALEPSAANELYTEMGNISYRAKKHNQVIAVLEKKQGIDAKTMSTTDYFNLGRSYYSLASTKLTEANSIKDAKQRAAKIEEAMPWYVKADTAFSGLIRSNPKWVVAYINKGRSSASIDYINKSSGLAKSYYEKVLELVKPEERAGANKNNVIEAYEYLGAYYTEVKDNDNATAMWTALKELDPANVKANNYLSPKKPGTK